LGDTPKLEKEVWAAAHGHPASFSIIKAFLLEHYKCLPSQLAQEDAHQVLLNWQIYNKVMEGKIKK
jgi:hypothetical protein